MTRRPPAIVFALGLAGLIPFIATGLGTVGTTDAAVALRYLDALVAYGAVILSFLGGVHWGFALGEAEGRIATRRSHRLLLGIAASLVGFAALLVLFIGFGELALAILLAAFVALTLAEADLSRRGLVPTGYMFMRWVLSAVVALILAVVILFRLTGMRLIF